MRGAALLGLAGVALCGAFLAGCARLAPAPTAQDAARKLSAAVQSGDDTAVVAALSEGTRSSVLASGAAGAALRMRELYPRLGTMQVQPMSDTEASLVDTADPDPRLILSEVGGQWVVTSARYSELETSSETFHEAAQVNRTKYLPAGARIKISGDVPGRRELTSRVLKLNGAEQTRTVVSINVAKTPVAAESWLGTGKRRKAAVSNLRTGSKFNKAASRVTNDSRVVDGRKGTVAASMRMSNAPGGTKMRIVLLGPDDTELVSDAERAKGGYDWWDCIFWWNSDGAFEPTGTWIAVAEVNGRPVKWKVFRVK